MVAVSKCGMAKYHNEEYLRKEYIDNGRSTRDIAEDCGVDKNTIRKWMDKNNIETRDRIEAVKRAVEVNYANYTVNNKGYPYWKATVSENTEKHVYVARLLAVAEYGFEAVRDKEVHHKNSIPWDNRPDNIEPVTRKEHAQAHADEYDCAKNRPTPYRDEDTLRQLYLEKEMSTHEIADKFDVAASTINLWCKKHGIELRPDYYVIQEEY